MTDAADVAFNIKLVKSYKSSKTLLYFAILCVCVCHVCACVGA